VGLAGGAQVAARDPGLAEATSAGCTGLSCRSRRADARPEDGGSRVERRPPRRLRYWDDTGADHDQDAKDLMMNVIAGDPDVAQPGPWPRRLTRISLVTSLVMMKVTSIARNIDIMGRRENLPCRPGP
jgi:hypothetical protein